MDIENKECKICKTNYLVPVISFGQMPAANAFLKKEDLDRPEYKYEMAIGFCLNCKMVQMINIVPYDKYIVPDETGKTNYAFYSSTSKAMEEHFGGIAKEIEERFLEEGSRVMDIGSNDGIFLQHFKKNEVLGIEPSDNVAEVARQKGIETITKFFSTELAKDIVFSKGKFRAIFSANVILNIIDIHDLTRGIYELLDDKGVFVMENPYIVDILEKTSYDQIYDEHIWFFSLMSCENLLNMYGMEIFDAEKLWVHGGSLRIYACKKGAREKTERFKRLFEEEIERKINLIEPYSEFARNVEESKRKLKDLLGKIKNRGEKIVGYAAASKGTIVLNYCDIGKEMIDYIADSTPYKQGRFSPGKHIPIVSPEYFKNDKEVKYALLGAWNHGKEIMKKEMDFLKRGGKFIVHYPEARILDPKEFGIEINEINNIQKIEEIGLKRLNIFANDQGYLFETLRNDDKLFDGKFGQVLVSVVYPGIIKGLHLHKKQTDYTACIKGNLKYVAVKEVPGKEPIINAFIIGERNPVLIKCPPGIWHGYMPLSNKEAVVLHTMDKSYDPRDPDTEEKDVFFYGDVWTPKHG